MLNETDYQNMREELDSCKRPIFLFHDDPDGLSSFLLFYRYKKEGKGIPVKARPIVDDRFIKPVLAYEPDKIFVLDIAIVEQEFIDQMKVPVVWIDHHEPLKRNKVRYFNPTIDDPHLNYPVSQVCYNVVKEDLWVAMCGITGDWVIDDELLEKFLEKYPDLARKGIKNPGELIHSTRLGKMTRIMSFILKGTPSEAMKCAKIMTRTQSPYEILDRTTPPGRYVYKKYEDINKAYEKLLKEASSNATKDKMIIYVYNDDKMSFTSDLSNELLFKYPKKIILVGRRKSGEIKLSLRSGEHTIVRDILKKALEGVEGYGGGHEYACGACVKEKDFDTFIEQFRQALSERK